MSHNEEHVRCILIGACTASASRAMDAAAIEVNRGTPGEQEVVIFPGTRVAERITAGERDRRARETLAELRQRLAHLDGLYPCESRVPLADLDAAAGGE